MWIFTICKKSRLWVSILFFGVITACSLSPDKVKLGELPDNVPLMNVGLAWSVKTGGINFPLEVKVIGSTIYVASANGDIRALNAQSGEELWKFNVGSEISAAVGSDGRFTSVITRRNELVVLDQDKEIWRNKLQAEGFTPPLVISGRVFVMTADRAISAFDLLSGRKIWTNQRPTEALILKQSGVMIAVKDTLVVGGGGRVLGLNPANGSIRWDVPISLSRGTNDIERLVDLVAPVARQGDVICARSFQTAIGCVDTVRGVLLWSKPGSGFVGLSMDDKFVFGAEQDGKVIAWRKADGERAWTTERLLFRKLSVPLVLGRSVAIADANGFIHLLSREDGSPLTRLTTDGSAVVGSPVLAAGTLVVITQNGGVFGFKPE